MNGNKIAKEWTAMNETIILCPPIQITAEYQQWLYMEQKHQYWPSINISLTKNPHSFCKYDMNIQLQSRVCH